MRRAAAVLLLVALSPASAAHPERLTPESPADGAVTGREPRFVVRAQGGNVEGARFKIEVSRDGFRTIAYTFDQLADPNGWAYADLESEAPGAVYAPRRPVEGGSYAWRVSSWDGVTWKLAAPAYRFDVDDVPPAEVHGLVIRRDAPGGCVRLEWEPVVADRRGGVERIARYHVLRFTSPAPPRPLFAAKVGESPAASYADCDPALGDRPLLYYLVVAEDEAGNVAGPPSSFRR